MQVQTIQSCVSVRGFVMTNLFRCFQDDQRGNAGVVFALAAVPVFALMGGISDYASIQNERHKLQAALDAGVLAAVEDEVGDSQAAKERVWKYLETNYKASPKVHFSKDDLRVSLGTGAKVITANMSVSFQTSFLGLIGIGSMSLKIVSQAVKGGQTVIEMALVMDASYAMTCNASGFDPSVDEPTYTKRVQAREAVATFIDRLKTKLDETPGIRLKMALVPYSTYVRLSEVPAGSVPDWVQLKGVSASDWRGYLGPRDPSENLDAIDGNYDTYPVPGVAPRYREDSSATHEIEDLLPGIKALRDLSEQSNVDALRNHVRSMISEGPAYIPSGITWGWRVLSPRAPFDEGDSANKVHKVMIVIAGGGNLCEYDHDGLVKCYDAADTSHADDRMRAVCRKAKQHGIDIIGISFYPHDYERDHLHDLLQECQNRGLYEAGNKAELISVLDRIADEIVVPGGRQVYLSR